MQDEMRGRKGVSTHNRLKIQLIGNKNIVLVHFLFLFLLLFLLLLLLRWGVLKEHVCN